MQTINTTLKLLLQKRIKMNINVDINKYDLRKLNYAINNLKRYSAVKFYNDIQRAGLNISYKVKKDAPFDTGNLRLNVKWDGKAIRSDAPYSGFLEFGTKNQRQQKYFFDNVLSGVKRLVHNIEVKINRTIRR